MTLAGALPPEVMEIRRAAFELRQRDPSEAVRVLRRLAKGDGEFVPLAHGALAEILLEDFDDVDAALHHFRRFVELAPEVTAGQHGLARALARSGDPVGAHEAFQRAAEGLTQTVRAAMATPEEAEGAEAALILLLETALEDRTMLLEEHLKSPPIEVPADLLSWAEAERVFDDEDEPEDVDEWLRYALLAAELAGGVDEALATVDRLAALVPLPQSPMHHLRSVVLERHGRVAEAATEAKASLEAAPDAIDPDEAMRAAELLAEAGRSDDARAVLERARTVLSSALDRDLPDEVTGELKEALASVEERLRASAGKLVSLGGRLGMGRPR